MNLTEKTLTSEQKYAGRIIDLFVDEVELPNGKHSKREYVKHNGGAAILLIKNNAVLLVKQFRYAYGKTIYEIPAGKLEKGEEPKNTAMRELEEETGFIANQIEPLATIYPTPGYTNEIIHIFYAPSYVVKEQKLDTDEFLNVEFIDINEVLHMIENGEICDSKTIVAVYKYLLMKN